MTIARQTPKLILVTDRHRALLPLPELARQAVAGGIDLFQIREKDLDNDALAELVAEVIETIGDRSKVAVNGTPDLAAKLGIGLHLAEVGISPSTARTIVGGDTLIGRSVHSPKSTRDSDGADFLIAGHVFASISKPRLPPLGIAGFRSIVEATTLPVIAIGGVHGDNVESVLAAGAYGVAVISAINNSRNPERAAHSLKQRIDSWRTKGGDNMTTATTIELTINGKQVVLATGSTVSDFLRAKGLEERLVVVELNESIVPRTDYASTILNDGDRVEIVHFVGGG